MKSIMNNVMQSKEEKYKVNPQPWYKLITVEPPLFLYMMAFMITSVIEQAFYVYRTCRVNHGLSHEICNNLTAYQDLSNEVQVTLSVFHQWNGIAGHIAPFLLAFFLGSWSDKRGRKSIVLAGLIGKLIWSFMVTVNTWQDWPIEYIIYTATIPSTLTGADLAIFAGCFAYLADVTTTENRTMRIGILDAVYLSTMPTGVALGNLLYNKVVNKNYTIMFAINTTLMALATLYCLFFLKWQTSPQQKSMKVAGVVNPITDFFDMNNIKSTVVTLTKKRGTNGRIILWLLLLSMALYTFQRDERPVMYLYTMTVFQWDATNFSNFRTYLSSAYVIAMILGIPLMTKYLKWRDTVIVMLGATAHICGHLIYAQATSAHLMYVGATVAALGPCVAPLIRSMTSKLLPSEERGVAYAFLSVMENLVGLFASIIYSQIYKATLDTSFINAVFYLTILTQAVVFLCSLIMDLLLKGKMIGLQEIPEEKDVTDTSSIM